MSCDILYNFTILLSVFDNIGNYFVFVNIKMIKRFFRMLYNHLISEEKRYWIYKLRNFNDVERLKYQVFPSDKGDFSLRGFFKHKCVFVHITKSAGTSLALSLFGELPYHYTAQKYRVIYGKRDFDRFFKFTFVRNPWDRLYSSYSYLKGGGWNKDDAAWAKEHLSELKDFEDFVMNWLSKKRLASHIHLWPQSKFICDRRGLPIIDYLGYFETINDDFKYIVSRLNLHSRDLKHTNQSNRAGYTNVFTKKMRDKVANLYSQDISNFGYDFTGFNRMEIVDKSFKIVDIKK